MNYLKPRLSFAGQTAPAEGGGGGAPVGSVAHASGGQYWIEGVEVTEAQFFGTGYNAAYHVAGVITVTDGDGYIVRLSEAALAQFPLSFRLVLDAAPTADSAIKFVCDATKYFEANTLTTAAEFLDNDGTASAANTAGRHSIEFIRVDATSLSVAVDGGTADTDVATDYTGSWDWVQISVNATGGTSLLHGFTLYPAP